MHCWKQNDLFSTIKINAISCNKVTVFVNNVISLLSQADRIVSDKRIINNNIIGFTETQIKSSDSTCKMIETLSLFNINFDKNENNFLVKLTGVEMILLF